MLDGKVQHEDFKGHKGIIGPGDVQWMQGKLFSILQMNTVCSCSHTVRAAARGSKSEIPTCFNEYIEIFLVPVVHSEMPIHGPGLPDPVGLQLWVDLPKVNKLDAPDYQEWTSNEMPTAHPSSE